MKGSDSLQLMSHHVQVHALTHVFNAFLFVPCVFGFSFLSMNRFFLVRYFLQCGVNDLQKRFRLVYIWSNVYFNAFILINYIRNSSSVPITRNINIELINAMHCYLTRFYHITWKQIHFNLHCLNDTMLIWILKAVDIFWVDMLYFDSLIYLYLVIRLYLFKDNLWSIRTLCMTFD